MRRSRSAGAWGGPLGLALLLLAACGDDVGLADDPKRACELLSLEAEVPLLPVAAGTARMSIGDALEERRPGPAFDVSVYLKPDRSSELHQVEREVREVEGVEVVAVLDQEAVYDEFLTLFADREDLTATVVPSIMPSAVRATVVSEDQVAALDEALGEDRIYEIVYEYGLKANVVRGLVDQFDDEFEELERTTNDELQDSFAVIRSDGRPSPAELRSALAEVGAFRESECGAPSD